LRFLFLQHPRVVRLKIDGESVIVPLVAVLYLISNPPHPIDLTLKVMGQRRMKIEHWDFVEPVVWPDEEG